MTSKAHLIVFHRLVQKNAALFPAVCLVPAQGQQLLVIFVRLLVAQLDLQGANMWARHVVPESHAVRRVLRVNDGAQQPGNFAFLAFVSLRVDEVAISCYDKGTALGIVTRCHFLCSTKKSQLCHSQSLGILPRSPTAEGEVLSMPQRECIPAAQQDAPCQACAMKRSEFVSFCSGRGMFARAWFGVTVSASSVTA